MSFLHKVEFAEAVTEAIIKETTDFDQNSIIEDPESLSKSQKCKKCCVESYHPTKKIPIIVWIQDYQLNFIIRDIVAGMTSSMSHFMNHLY